MRARALTIAALISTALLFAFPAHASPKYASKTPKQLEDTLTGLWAEKNFPAIEEFYQEILKTNEEFENPAQDNGYVLIGFHALNRRCMGAKDCERLLNLWVKEVPNCQACKIAQVYFFSARAWEARGKGYVRELGKSALDGWNKNMQLASDWMDRIGSSADADLAYQLKRMKMAHEFGFPPEVTNRLYEDAIKLNPYVQELHEKHAYYSLPKWGGKPGDIRYVAERAADVTSEKRGNYYYMFVAVQMGAEEGDKLFSVHKFSWPRMRKGFDELIAMNPETNNLLTAARFAWMVPDKEYLSSIIQKLGDWKPEFAETFGSAEKYKATKEWAKSNEPDKPKSTPLIEAIVQGDRNEVERLLNSGADVNEQDAQFNDPVGFALHEHPELFDLLVSKGAKLKNTGFRGEPLICVAAATGNLAAVKKIIPALTTPNARGRSQKTPLWFATEYNFPSIIETLTQNGADPNDIELTRHQTVLMLAAETNRLDAAKVLLNAKKIRVNEKDDDGMTALHYAAKNGHHEMAQLLIANGADPKIVAEGKGSAIGVARANDNTELSQALTREVIAERGDTPLSYAVRRGDKETVQKLLDNHAKVNELGQLDVSALSNAVQFHPELVDLLLEHGAAVGFGKIDGESLLYVATQKGDAELVLKFMKKGGAIPIIRSVKTQKTPFHVAVEMDSAPLIEALMFEPIFVPEADDGVKHQTPLQLAAELNALNAARALLKHPKLNVNKSNLDVTLRRRVNALSIAEAKGNAEMVKLLKDHGALPPTLRDQ